MKIADRKHCTGCGACGKARHVLNPPEKRRPEKAFAAWTAGDVVRTSGSSGEVYSVRCEYMLGNGGVISGFRFDGDMVQMRQMNPMPPRTRT